MIVNRGYYKDLPNQCKMCIHLKVFSLKMDNNHYYSCNKYPLSFTDEICPKFEKIIEYGLHS